MKSPSHFFRAIPAVAAAALLLEPVRAQEEHENPNQKGVERVTSEAPEGGVRANIVPLIWRAKIDDAVIAVPLRSIEYYGVQIYDTDSQTRVHELTICTESRSLVRIYYILPLGTANERLSEAADRLRKIAQTGSRQEWIYPVKQYPTTTHQHMVEYRVGKKEDVQEIYDHLEAAMIEYHARDLVPDQRDSVVRKIEVKAE
jgi:hypothetical protein